MNLLYNLWPLNAFVKSKKNDGTNDNSAKFSASTSPLWWQLLLVSLLFNASFANNEVPAPVKPSLAVTSCAGAIVLNPASLPIINQEMICGNTNDLNATSVANICGTASSISTTGSESLYSLTPTVSALYTISADSSLNYPSVFVYAGCPTSGGICLDSYEVGGNIYKVTVALTAGIEYFIWFDSASASPCPNSFSISAPVIVCSTPATQPTALTFNSITQDKISGSFTAASPAPSKYLVVRSIHPTAPSPAPVDGTSYQVGTSLLGSGTYIVQNSNSTTFTTPGLLVDTQYYYYIYSFNDNGCAPAYKTTIPLSNSAFTLCQTPTTITPHPTTANSATITWPALVAANCIVEYGQLGFAPGTAATAGTGGTIATGNISPVILTGLASNSNYRVFVRQICANGGYSSNSDAINFKTECDAVLTFPSTENFSTMQSTSAPACWKKLTGGTIITGPSTTQFSKWTGGSFLNTGSAGAAKILINTTNYINWLVTPMYTLPVTPVRVKYNVGATASSTKNQLNTPWEADDFVELLISNSMSDWTVLKTYNSSNVPSHLGQLDMEDLSAYLGQTVRFAFRVVEGAVYNGASTDFFIDNFIIEANAGCGIPNNGVASISAGDACTGFPLTVTATGLSSGTAIAYLWQTSSDGSIWTDVASATSSYYTFMALEGTFYYRLSTTCPDSNQTSYSNSISYSGNNCAPINVPITGEGTANPCGNNVIVYDDGGPLGNYSNNANGYIVLENSGTSVIKLSVTYNNMPGDYIRIYRGEGITGTILQGQYSGVVSNITVNSAPGQPLTIQLISNSSDVSSGFAIAAIYSGACALCSAAPLDASVMNNSTTSSTASWTPVAPAPTLGYEYAVTTTASVPTFGTMTTTSSVNLTVAAGINYWFHVRAVCEIGTQVSSWVTVPFKSQCATITSLPYNQPLDQTTECYTITDATTQGWSLLFNADGIPQPQNGFKFAGIKSSSTSTDTNSVLTLPKFNLSTYGVSPIRVSAWIYRGNEGLLDDDVTILVNSSASITNATILMTVPRNRTMAPLEATVGWYKYSVEIPPSFNTADFHIMFRGRVSGNTLNNSVGIDNITIDLAPASLLSVTTVAPSEVCASDTAVERTVILTGTGFVGTTSVKFNGMNAASFIVDSNTQISAVVNALATSGLIIVTSGSDSSTEAVVMTVNQPTIWYADNDGDGYGNINMTISACSKPLGYVSQSGDCDDNDNTVFQTAQLFVDNDNDGYTMGLASNICYGLEIPEGYTSTSLGDDCDDNDATVYQSAILFVDMDGDGYTVGEATSICYGATIPAGYVATSMGVDCDDDNANVYQSILVYADSDGDGYTVGDAIAICFGTEIPDGFTSTSLGVDCDDNDASVWQSQLLFVDMDGDQYTVGEATSICFGAMMPEGYAMTSIGEDCNDQDANAWQSATVYVDMDGDGFHGSVVEDYCFGGSLPEHYSNTTQGFDCNDNNAAINPDAIEIPGNGIDENCNGMQDDEVATGLTTMIKANQCGSVLAKIYTSVFAQASIPNVTMYTFEVTNPSNLVQTISTTTNHFPLTSLANYEYNTAYSIRVGVQVNGVWQGYGLACTVTTPLITNALSLKECGMTRNIYSPISAHVVPGATGYKFRITNMSNPGGPNGVMEIERQVSWFHLTLLPSYEYSTTYSVQVAIKTTGAYSDYGAACDISTIPFASLSLSIKQCGVTYSNIYSSINASVIPNVSGYRFRVTNLTTLVAQVIDPAQSWINFNQISSFTAGGNYSVEVAVKTSGDFGPYGPACTITAPGAIAARQMAAAEVKIVAFPNPFSETFALDITRGTEGLVEVQVYDMIGKLLEVRSVQAGDLSSLALGNRFPAGVYNIVVTHQETVQILRVIKR